MSDSARALNGLHRPERSDDFGLAEPALEAIAQRVAELVGGNARPAFRLLDTESVASMLSVSEEWVRAHAAELGGLRLGDGPKGALRFEAARVRNALEGRRLKPARERRRLRPGPRRRSGDVFASQVPFEVKDW